MLVAAYCKLRFGHYRRLSCGKRKNQNLSIKNQNGVVVIFGEPWQLLLTGSAVPRIPFNRVATVRKNILVDEKKIQVREKSGNLIRSRKLRKMEKKSGKNQGFKLKKNK